MDKEMLDLGATRKTFKCDQFEEGFSSMVGLKNYVKSDHKKAKELPKMHKGRTIEYNCPYPECNKSLPSAREVKQYLEKEHRKTQALLGGNEDLDLSVRRPPSTKRVVIFQVAREIHCTMG